MPSNIEEQLEKMLSKYAECDSSKDYLALVKELTTLIQKERGEAELQSRNAVVDEIYKMGLRYEALVSEMKLGNEESALLLDDFIKDILALKEGKEIDGSK